MKTRIFTRLLIQSSLLLSLVSCSDATQFAEKALPATLDASKPSPGTDTTTDTAETPSTPPEGEIQNKPDTTGTDTGSGVAGPVGNPNSGTPGTGTPGDGTGPGSVFQECSAHAELSIVSQLYQLPVNTSRLPDFSTMTSVGDVCIASLNIADRDFTQGFPGVSDIFEWFALDMRFKVTISKAGTYKFYLNSDDGSILSIDDEVVVDNDGTHSQIEKSGSKVLGVGVHDFHVRYYQGPRTRIALELFWKVPGRSAKVYLPTSVMSRP